jgi:hypothetical protein
MEWCQENEIFVQHSSFIYNALGGMVWLRQFRLIYEFSTDTIFIATQVTHNGIQSVESIVHQRKKIQLEWQFTHQNGIYQFTTYSNPLTQNIHN